MSAFQVFGIAFAGLALAATVSARKRMSRRVLLSWTALWLGSVLFIAFPHITVVLAHTLGISRGADLVFYCSILGGLVGFLAIFLRLRRIELSLTQIARRMAIESAQKGDEDNLQGPDRSTP